MTKKRNRFSLGLLSSKFQAKSENQNEINFIVSKINSAVAQPARTCFQQSCVHFFRKAGVFIESILLCLSCFGCRCGLVVRELACLQQPQLLQLCTQYTDIPPSLDINIFFYDLFLSSQLKLSRFFVCANRRHLKIFFLHCLKIGS